MKRLNEQFVGITFSDCTLRFPRFIIRLNTFFINLFVQG
ncbi:hypothetical protein SynMVIR181_01603 [Synechococcus sp. MVIR-18-1]|nr:hypothetical protein SynMVIR181_01603 [Synechococcus sp. MVIR-18-1]